jgi:hypothetical protein
MPLSSSAGERPLNSFISHFRPVIAVVLSVLVIELLVWGRYGTNIAIANNFLSLKFPQRDETTRATIYEKMRVFGSLSPEIVQAGDSSGLMGIHAEVVEQYLPAGVDFVNMSCCATVGYRGPYAIFRYFLENTPNVKMLVLYNSPAGNLPSDFNNVTGGTGGQEFGNDIYDNYEGWRSYFALPSLFFREDIVTYAYYAPLYWAQGLSITERVPITSHPLFKEFINNLNENRGFIADPETQINDKRAWGAWASMEECRFEVKPYAKAHWFDVAYATYIEATYSVFAELARKYGVKLVIAHQVIPCPLGTGAGSQAARDAIARFKERYPEVEFPFDVVTHWDKSKFAVPAHVRNIHTDELSRRLGEALAPIYQKAAGH